MGAGDVLVASWKPGSSNEEPGAAGSGWARWAASSVPAQIGQVQHAVQCLGRTYTKCDSSYV